MSDPILVILERFACKHPLYVKATAEQRAGKEGMHGYLFGAEVYDPKRIPVHGSGLDMGWEVSADRTAPSI